MFWWLLVPKALAVEIPEAFDANPTEGGLVEGPWWDAFADPGLDQLMQTALSDNLDLGQAHERVQAAEALLWQQRSILVPSLSVEVQASMQPIEALTFGNVALQGSNANLPDRVGFGSAYLQGALQVDLFAQGVLSTQAAGLDSRAFAGDRDTLALAVSAMVAAAYYDVVAFERQVAVVEDQISANEELLELAQLRYQTGGGTSLEVLQQGQQTSQTRAALPGLRQASRLARQRLALLLGQPASTNLEVATGFPVIQSVPGLGTPEALVGRHPEVEAQRLRYESSQRRASAAVRGLLPSLQVMGQTGYGANYFDEFDSQYQWLLSGSLSVPLFNGGRSVGAIRQAQASKTEAGLRYQQAIYTAVQQVEAALIVEQEAQNQLNATQEQLQTAQAAYDESRVQYTRGVLSYVVVLTATNALQTAQRSMVAAERAVIDARISLFQALGGSTQGDAS